MKVAVRPLLVLHEDPEFRQRAADAAGPDYRMAVAGDWPALRELIRTSPPSAMVVVDPYHGNGTALAPALKELLGEFPSVVVFAAMKVDAASLEDLRTLGRWGLAQVVSVGHDDTREAMAVRFRESRGRPLRVLLDGVMPDSTPARARGILDAAAGVVASGGHGRDLARQLGVSRRTLLRWCELGGLPAPRRMLAWMRILLAAQLLDDPGRSVLTVAQACGYSSDSGLRRVMQKFVRASPSQLRRHGAFRLSSAIFLQMLERCQRRMPSAA